jgi:Domain of unknown function (DUF1995)
MTRRPFLLLFTSLVLCWPEWSSSFVSRRLLAVRSLRRGVWGGGAGTGSSSPSSWRTLFSSRTDQDDAEEPDDSMNSDDDEDDGDDDSLDRFRKSLESLWDVKTMGAVPTDAQNAAETTALALERAIQMAGQQQNNNNTYNVFFVNLLVPTYDIDFSAAKLYDEVLAVEFCIALAQRLTAPSMICVRDTAVLTPVQRILDARENGKIANPPSTEAPQSSPRTSRWPSEDPFADLAVTKPTIDEQKTLVVKRNESDEVKNFRVKLMADWTPLDEDTLEADDEMQKADDSLLVDAAQPFVRAISSYRLTSLLGDMRSFSSAKGPALMNEVVAAVARNALPQPQEEFIILLAPSTKEEMIGLRALLQKYIGRNKRFIIVNSKLEPLPIELRSGETIYSVLPLMGKRKATTGGGGNSSTNNDIMDTEPPKAVLLRRYPRDWELYVDIGKGFDLAASCGAATLTGANRITGPSMQWVQSKMEAYLVKMR